MPDPFDIRRSDDFLDIISNTEIESRVETVRSQTKQAVEQEQESQRRFSFLDRLGEIEDTPGSNIINDFILGKLASTAPQRVETFEDFMDRRSPARDFLTNVVRAQTARRSGRRFVSVREEAFKEFQAEQAAQREARRLQSQNQNIALQLAAAKQRQDEGFAFRARLSQIEAIENREERELELLRFGLEHNLNVKELNRKIKNDEAQQDEKRLNRIAGSGPPLIKEIRDQINREFPKLIDTNPTEYNEKVNNRYDKLLAEASNRKIAERRAGKNTINIGNGGGTFSPQQIRGTLNRVLFGEQSLAQARKDLTAGEDASAYYKMVDMGAGRIIRNRPTREAFSQASTGLAQAGQLQGLVAKAREVFNQSSQGFILQGIDEDSKAFQGLRSDIEGFFLKLSGAIGPNAAATVLDRLVPGMATNMARAGGETGRISDADIKRFIKQAPQLSDTPEELKLLDEEITSLIGNKLLSTIRQEAPKLGKRVVDMETPPRKASAFLLEFRRNTNLQQAFGTTDAVEAFVQAWEEGQRFTF